MNINMIELPLNGRGVYYANVKNLRNLFDRRAAYPTLFWLGMPPWIENMVSTKK